MRIAAEEGKKEKTAFVESQYPKEYRAIVEKRSDDFSGYLADCDCEDFCRAHQEEVEEWLIERKAKKINFGSPTFRKNLIAAIWGREIFA